MKKLRQTSIISLICTAFLAGLLIGRHSLVTPWLLIAPIIILALIWRSRWRVYGLILLALSLGIWRAQIVVVHDQVLISQLGQKVQLSGRVQDDPSTSDTGQTSFTLALDHLDGQPYRATVAIYTYRQPVKRGFQIFAAGKLKPALGSAQAELSYPQVTITNNQLSLVERWRLKFFAAERTAIPEPLASLGLGLLIGARALIPKNLQNLLAAVGLSHLIAVSGYNLTILINAARRLLGRSKFIVLATSLWLIIGFVILAGASASIMRAALVSGLTLAAGYFGRQFKPVVLILLAAALTTLINPHSLWSDLGWQLSFAAFSGILILAPLLQNLMKVRQNFFIAIGVEAMAAYLLTLPIILHTFGALPPAAILANVLVMPLVPLAMLLSFVAAMVAWLVPPLAGWLGAPATWTLRAIMTVVEQTARFKPINVSMSAGLEVAWYGLIGLLILTLARRHQRISNDRMLQPAVAQKG